MVAVLWHLNVYGDLNLSAGASTLPEIGLLVKETLRVMAPRTRTR